MSIPVSVIVTTKDEAARIERCLLALRDFAELVVVDSGSTDATAALAAECGARVERFAWNGRYPKKRQWCLDTLNLAHDWVLFVDADEVMTHSLAAEIAALFATPPPAAGYFITGRYVICGRVMRYGAANRKLALFDRNRMAFPVVDDLDLPGMGEMEGHYQPVYRAPGEPRLGVLKNPLLHDAHDGGEDWTRRHRRYAAWEAAMNARNAWPDDPVPRRNLAKRVFRALPARGAVAFLHSYVYRLGILDGRAGLSFALDRARYYRMIGRAQAR